MKITTVSTAFHLKIPLVDYGNAEISVSYSATLEEGDDPRRVAQELTELARQDVANQVMPIAVARLAQTDIAHVAALVKEWKPLQILRLLMPQIDFSQFVALNEEHQKLLNALWFVPVKESEK
jgi:hypothetical protein